MGNNPVCYRDPDGRTPTDLEAAYMAKDVYDFASKKILVQSLPGGWKRTGIEYLSNGEKGGCIGIYSRNNPETGQLEYTLANKGTNPFYGSDWKENFSQPFGNSEDMRMSIAIANKFVSDHPESEVTFTGHSKGGAEATANAIATGKMAIIFNPATSNLSAYGLDASNFTAGMKAYVVQGEILNYLFGIVSEPIDQQIMLPRTLLSNIIGDGIISGIYNHSMDSVISGMNRMGIE